MLEVAVEHYQRQQTLGRATAAAAGSLWTSALDLADLDGSFLSIAPGLLAVLVQAQLAAAAAADGYLSRVLEEQNITSSVVAPIAPAAFTAVASDGRSLASLLREPLFRVKTRLLEQAPAGDAMASGLASLQRIVATQVADAGREADGVALVARPAVSGYVRMLTLPSCPRCVVLAGAYYKWNTGFRRHPQCDCRHIPASEDTSHDLRTDPVAAVKSGQVTGLSEADRKAIVTDDADPGQVINANRGMYTATAFGRVLKGTLEGTTKRGVYGKAELAAGRRPGRGVRLRPEEIYQLAGDDRAEALRLLIRFGYLAKPTAT